MCEHIVNRMSDVGVANLATRQLSVSTARTAWLRELREAKSLPYSVAANIQ